MQNPYDNPKLNRLNSTDLMLETAWQETEDKTFESRVFAELSRDLQVMVGNGEITQAQASDIFLKALREVYK
jgi:hypothetical protein